MTQLPLSIGASFVGLISLWYLAPFAYRRYYEQRLGQLCRSERVIVLTYDDGPGVNLTPLLLDLLRDHSVSATFFVLGRRVEDHPDLVRRLLYEGHEVGSHTYDHTNAWRALPARVVRDVDAGIALVAEQGGDATLFRPPFGKLTAAGLVDGRRRGLRYGWWTIDSGDSWARKPISDVVGEVEAKRGGVILMHDFDRYDVTDDGVSHVDHVLSLTERVIDFARTHGYQLRTLDQLHTEGRPD